MNAMHRPADAGSGSAPTPLLRTLLLADLAESTALIDQLGDVRGAILLQRLDLQTRDLLGFTGGRLIDKSDGLLALFERPVQAVDFALRYQRLLQELSLQQGMSLQARVGIHVGEVMTWENPPQAVAAGAKPLEVEGLAKPVAARLMGLALPSQILLSGMAQTLAQRAQAELGERVHKLRWLVHGRYGFKGVPAPMIVHEVGEAGLAPLKAPPSSSKAWREVPFWRRPPVLAMEAMLAVGLIGASLYSVFKSPPAIAFHERDWVVVGDMSNFTGDPRLEDSLDTALRVSLEQSRYVNLVPELKVQAALKRMARDEHTAIDRAVGSEIALREGARALLLPSIAEVGGRLRVNIEVVDPNTQVTVYAESAEGRGAESALTSLDAVNSELRARLGESMSEIEANGKPLAQVTTGSLDALRFFTLANDAARQARFAEAMRLLTLAIEKDGRFALAYANRAQLHAAGGRDLALARRDYALAAKYRDRLSTREALMLDANLAAMGPPEPMIERLDVLIRAYPDSFGARRRAAQVNWAYLQQYQRALATLQPALDNQNPALSSAMYLNGLLHLAMENYPAADAAFRKYESLGGRGFNRDHGDLYAAQRQYARAERALRKSDATGMKAADLDMRLPEVTYVLDQGRWSEAVTAAGRLRTAAAAASPLQASAYEAIELELLSYGGDAKAAERWRVALAQAMAQSNGTSGADAFHSRFFALHAAAWLVRLGDAEAGQRTLTALGEPVANSGYPTLQDMLAILRAELALSDNKPQQAVAELKARVQGSELYRVHAALLRAYRQENAVPEARLQADWLASHRGRAYVEWSSQYLLQPGNVLISNLALLDAAELALAVDDVAATKAHLDKLTRAWRRPPAFVAGRLRQVQAGISSRKDRTSPAAAR
jgi:putative peptide modification system cyclase